MPAIRRIGKTKVRVDVQGCIDCGTQYSSRWHHARIVAVVIDGATYPIDTSRCADCAARPERTAATAAQDRQRIIRHEQ